MLVEGEKSLRIPIFLFNGFLEAGKTSFMSHMLNKPVFADGNNTLVIRCEEGIEEYDETFLKENHISLVTLDEEIDLTDKLLLDLAEKCKPARVLIEYNGMWDITKFFDLNYPSGWFLYQIITLVNAETFNLYVNNMRSLMMEQFRCADLVLINRVNDTMNLSNFRGSVKAVNNQAKLFICTEDFKLDPVQEELPYDVNAEVLEIEKEHYGTWYIDLWEKPQLYMNKKVKVNGLFFQDPSDPKDRFTFGRFAMPCCADDIALMGLYCHNIGKPRFQNKDSIAVEAVIKYEPAEVYNGDPGPILYVKKIQKSEQNQDDLVTFS